MLSKAERKPLSKATISKPTLESLAEEVRKLKERLEDLEELINSSYWFRPKADVEKDQIDDDRKEEHPNQSN